MRLLHYKLRNLVALQGAKVHEKVNMGRKVDLGRKRHFFKDRFKTCFDTAFGKISTNAAIPAKKYGFTKQKHIRGDETLKIYNFGPNVVYFGSQTLLWGVGC